MVLPYAVKVEPTFNLFFEARVAPTTATFALEVGLKEVPDVSFSVPPPLAPPTRALPGELVPIMRTGIVKVVPVLPELVDPPVPPELVDPPPKFPKRPPRAPLGVGDFRDVWELCSSSLNDSWTEVTFFKFKRSFTSVVVRGVPP